MQPPHVPPRGVRRRKTLKVTLPQQVADFAHQVWINATLLQQMGIDHERLTYRFLGLDQRLTGVEGAKVIPQLIG